MVKEYQKMSSLQKFHRRTNGGAPLVVEPPMVVNGNLNNGIWMAVDPTTNQKLILAPKSTEFSTSTKPWGSSGTVRGTVSTTNGIANTNTLYALGSSAHPMAYAAKTLTSGGYNTWYLPSSGELKACAEYNGKYMVRTGAFHDDTNWSSTGASYTVLTSSTEINSTNVVAVRMWDAYAYDYAAGSYNGKTTNTGTYWKQARAMRRML
jgi:hypothetical protein